MSVTEYVLERGKTAYENLKWELKYSSVVNWIFYPFIWVLRKERGLDFPFYFNNQKSFVESNLAVLMEWFNNFVNHHEPERYPGDTSLTLYNRMKYVLKNFHIYSNDTMSNLYFGTKLPLRDYQRLVNSYNNYYTGLIVYNTLSGVFLVAMNNYFFRTRKATLPTVLVASLANYFLFSANYRVSYLAMDSLFNQHVRRLGHGHLIHRYRDHYPRNIDYLTNI